jgi:hypothetical protein
MNDQTVSAYAEEFTEVLALAESARRAVGAISENDGVVRRRRRNTIKAGGYSSRRSRSRRS